MRVPQLEADRAGRARRARRSGGQAVTRAAPRCSARAGSSSVVVGLAGCARRVLVVELASSQASPPSPSSSAPPGSSPAAASCSRSAVERCPSAATSCTSALQPRPSRGRRVAPSSASAARAPRRRRRSARRPSPGAARARAGPGGAARRRARRGRAAAPRARARCVGAAAALASGAALELHAPASASSDHSSRSRRLARSPSGTREDPLARPRARLRPQLERAADAVRHLLRAPASRSARPRRPPPRASPSRPSPPARSRPASPRPPPGRSPRGATPARRRRRAGRASCRSSSDSQPVNSTFVGARPRAAPRPRRRATCPRTRSARRAARAPPARTGSWPFCSSVARSIAPTVSARRSLLAPALAERVRHAVVEHRHPLGGIGVLRSISPRL